MRIYNDDCIGGSAKYFADGEVPLLICDPPFGIGEKSFDKHYNRDEAAVIEGYEEAPSDYEGFTRGWMSEATRILAPTGSLFVVIGHSNLRHVLNAAADLRLVEINHLIWRYNFGVYTSRKFVTSHYHVLFYAKHPSNRTFNTHCRFGPDERDKKGGSLLYQDLEDVFMINREYHPGAVKNKNKLPDELVSKLVRYCSNEGDLVGDFFLGNFTTALVAKALGRVPVGFEKNPNAYKVGVDRLENLDPSAANALIKVRRANCATEPDIFADES